MDRERPSTHITLAETRASWYKHKCAKEWQANGILHACTHAPPWKGGSKVGWNVSASQLRRRPQMLLAKAYRHHFSTSYRYHLIISLPRKMGREDVHPHQWIGSDQGQGISLASSSNPARQKLAGLLIAVISLHVIRQCMLSNRFDTKVATTYFI